MLFKRFSLILFLTLFGRCIIAQPYTAQKVEGLPKAEYYNCVQDEQGYMLFATDIGLVRWDGKNAVIYDVKNGLPGNVVLRVERLQKGVLVFVHGFGLYRYEKGKTLRYQINDELTWLKQENSFPVFDVQNNKIFANIKSHVISFKDDIKTNEFITLFKADENKKGTRSANKTYYHIFKFGKHNFLIQSRNNKEKYIEKHLHVSIENPVEFDYAKLNDSFNIIRSNNKIRIRNSQNFKYLNKDPSHVFQTKDGSFIAFSGDGVYEVDGLLNFTKVISIKTKVYTHLYDASGNLWFNCGKEGVFRVLNSPTTPSYLERVTMIKPNMDKLYIGYESGRVDQLSNKAKITLINEDKNPPRDFTLVNGNIQLSNGTYFINGINNKPIRIVQLNSNFKVSKKDTLLYDSRNQITSWRYSPKLGRAISSQLPPEPLQMTSTAKTAVPFKKNQYLLGTTKGLWVLDKQKHKVQDLKIHPELDNSYISFTEKIGSKIAIGNRYSVFLFKGENARKVLYLDSTKKINITCFTSFSKYVALGTNSGLLLYTVLNNGGWKLVNVIGSLYLNSPKITELNYFNKKIYIGTENGLNIIQELDLLRIPVSKTYLNIKNIFKNYNQAINSPNPTIKYDEYLRVILDMVDLDNINPGIHFKYRIINSGSSANNPWIETDNEEIIAANLPHGKYTIEIKPLIFGLKNPNEIIRYSFEVVAPFYRRQSFFWILGAVFLAFLLYGVWAQIKISRTNNKLSKTQISLLRGALNPHMVFNSLNTLQSLFIGGKEKQAAQQIGHFTKFLRYNLNNYSLNLVTISNEIKNLEHYLELEKIRSSGKLEYSIKGLGISDLVNYKIPSLILQPIAENSVVHGKSDGILHIAVEVLKQEKSLIIRLQDNGGGIPNIEKFKKEGHGLTIVDQIILFFNKTQKTKIRTQVSNQTLNQKLGVQYDIIVEV